MTLPNRSRSDENRSAVARLTPRSIFSYWRLTWHRLTAVFGPPLLVLIVGVVAHHGTVRITEARADGRRSRAITDAADQLVSFLSDAETGQRGFLLTGNEEYLRPYLRAVDSVPAGTTSLKLAIDTGGVSAATKRDVDSLAHFSDLKMTEVAETIRLRRAAGSSAALALVNTNKGLAYMASARGYAKAVRDQEVTRLASRSADLTHYTNEVTLVVIFETGAAFLIALFVNVLLAREAAVQTRLAAERDEAVGALIDSNDELHATSEELQQQERSFRALAETMPQLVWSTHASGEAEYFNGRWLEYTGGTTSAPDSTEWRDAVHEADGEHVDGKWDHSFLTGDPFEVECRLRRGADGSYRWFLCRALPLRDETGKITRWFGTCTDVHDQRRAAEGLSVLAEASAVLAASDDIDDALRSVAQLAVPRLGDWCTVDLLQPDGSLRRIATVHSNSEKLAIAYEFNHRFPATPDEPGGVYAVLKTGDVQSSEITDEMIIAGVADPEKRRLLLALGLRSYVIAPVLIDDNAVGAITIVSAESGHFLGPSDISRVQELARRTSLAIERTQLFAETVSARDAESLSNALLRDSEAKLVLSMEAGGLGSWEWDIKRDVVRWSPQTERMHGLAEGAFTGSREEFASYIHPEDRERVASEIARTLADRLPTYHIKYRFLRTDGEVRWLEGFARLRTDDNGEPLSFLGVSHDVTEREELLEGEQQARRDAEAANAAKAIFLTTMSHELRTPLNAVSGYVDLLEMGVRGPVTDLQREDLRRIRRASQHLLSLINDILNYARLEAGSVEIHLSEVVIADSLAEMEGLIAPQLQAKGVTYEYRPC
ncbi:MAG: PAS domain-containing protein, partial [Gemmatimonadota bacterium]|nr:PAS domain-containing protein [Gemmatimonadota bacterium]